VEQVDELLAQTQLNIRIEGEEALVVRNNVADLRGGIELTIRGTLADPAPTGTVILEPGGKLVYADNEYEIEQAQLTFQNRLEPYIDLRARTEIRNYDIVLGLSGTLERLNPTFSSDAGLADLEVLALLSTGQELEDEGRLLLPGQRPESDVRASQFLAGQAAVALSQRVNTLFGFDRFRISPLPPESGRSLGGVQLTVGKRVSRDLFVTYATNPADSEQYIVRLEWQFSRNLVLVATRNGEDDTYAVDLEWERRY
jgi:translocation and assembly module TamB